MTWSAEAPMHYPREGLAIADAPAPSSQGTGSRIYAVGGDDGNGNLLNEVELYDPAANSWTVLPVPAAPAS
jgi:Kelch motif